MQLMPRLRIPLWAAVAIPAAAYAIRSLLRGSMAPDLPGDAMMLASLVIVLVLASRYGSTAKRSNDDLPDEVQGSNNDESSKW